MIYSRVLLTLQFSALMVSGVTAGNHAAVPASTLKGVEKVKGYLNWVKSGEKQLSQGGCSAEKWSKPCGETAQVCFDGITDHEYTDCADAKCSWGVSFANKKSVLGYFCRKTTACTEYKDMCAYWNREELEQPKSIFGWTCESDISQMLQEVESLYPEAAEAVNIVKDSGTPLQSQIHKTTKRPGDWCPKTCTWCGGDNDKKTSMKISVSTPNPSRTCNGDAFAEELCTALYGLPKEDCPLTVKLDSGSQVDASCGARRTLAAHVAGSKDGSNCGDGDCKYDYTVEGPVSDLNNLDAAVTMEEGSTMDDPTWKKAGFGSVGYMNSSTTTTEVKRPTKDPGLSIMGLLALIVIFSIYLLIIMPCAWSYWVCPSCCCYRAFLSKPKRRASKKRGVWTFLACVICLTPTCFCPVDVDNKVKEGSGDMQMVVP